MNKKYIDFVPAVKSQSKTTGAAGGRVMDVASRTTARGTRGVAQETVSAETPAAGRVAGTAKLGVVEDLRKDDGLLTKSVRMTRSAAAKNVGAAKELKTETETAEKAKAQKAKLSAKKAAGLEAIFEATLKKVEAADDKQTAKIPKTERPKSPFVNTEKINKRPLSKNVYQKKPVVPAKEEPSAPVTIISKPEKDSRVGTVVAIIVTIVLGATAGTVAFLLLPK